MMFDVKKVELEWAGKKLKIETGKIARQADSSVVVTYGGTTVMANVVAAKQVKPDMDFFPLTVNYQEKLKVIVYICSLNKFTRKMHR